jgi:hypothetical protein
MRSTTSTTWRTLRAATTSTTVSARSCLLLACVLNNSQVFVSTRSSARTAFLRMPTASGPFPCANPNSTCADSRNSFGDLAGSTFVNKAGLTFTLIPVNQTKPETVFVPFLAEYSGDAFTNSASLSAASSASLPFAN